MRVLHITTSVVEQSASFRIHKAIARAGVDSFVYVLQPSGGSSRVMYANNSLRNKIKKFLFPRVERKIIKGFSRSEKTPISLGAMSSFDKELVKKINPDIINLHWICGGFLSIEDVKWLSDHYPVVWTLHDSWAFTGGCHIPYDCTKYIEGCRDCSQIQPIYGVDLAKKVFDSKINNYCSAKFGIVTPSKWLADCAAKSRILKGKQICVIPNPLDVNRFHPMDKQLTREILGLPKDKKIILFGAMNSTSDENKGFRFLYEAIKGFNKFWKGTEVEIIVFGSGEPENAPDFGLPTHYMGRLNDDISLSLLYSSADVMIVPSKSENFPNTVLEAMGAGTPCVAFRIGGIPDQIIHLENGYLAKPYDSNDLANGIEYVLSDDTRWEELSRNARDKVVANYREDKIAKRYISLYKDIIEEHERK